MLDIAIRIKSKLSNRAQATPSSEKPFERVMQTIVSSVSTLFVGMFTKPCRVPIMPKKRNLMKWKLEKDSYHT